MQLICRQCGAHFTPTHEGIVNVCPTCEGYKLDVANVSELFYYIANHDAWGNWNLVGEVSRRYDAIVPYVPTELTGITCDICNDDWSYCPEHKAQAQEIIARRHAQ